MIHRPQIPWKWWRQVAREARNLSCGVHSMFQRVNIEHFPVIKGVGHQLAIGLRFHKWQHNHSWGQYSILFTQLNKQALDEVSLWPVKSLSKIKDWSLYKLTFRYWTGSPACCSKAIVSSQNDKVTEESSILAWINHYNDLADSSRYWSAGEYFVVAFIVVGYRWESSSYWWLTITLSSIQDKAASSYWNLQC